MDKIGVENLFLQTANLEGECTLCEHALLTNDESYLFSSDTTIISAYHKDCFWHMAVVMKVHFEKFGIPKGENAN